MQSAERIASLQAELADSQQQAADSRADCRDVLRLVDIMSASPAGIKAVLEAYLKKLGAVLSNNKYNAYLMFVYYPITMSCVVQGSPLEAFP